MGDKYTVEAGIGNEVVIYTGTSWLIVALFKLWFIKINHTTIYWKKITIR